MSEKLSAGQTFRSEGYQMYTDYLPDERGDPTIEKWAFRFNEEDPHEGEGFLEVCVHEVIQTQHSGTLAVYYRQWFAPDGEPLARPTRRVGSIGSLKAMIRRRKMSPVSDALLAERQKGGEA